MTARVFLQGINEVHPGNYIVVNDVTGGGTVAAENVRNAKPDGLNLLAYHTGLCTSIASGQYAHDLSEFTICGMFITVPDEATGGLFVPGNSKFDKLEDLIAYGKDNYKVVYIKGDTFTNELIQAIREGRNAEFREKYRGADVFLMDDVQFIAGRDSTQEDAFPTVS